VTIQTCSIVGSGIAARAIGEALVHGGIEVTSVSGRNGVAVARLASQLGSGVAAPEDIPATDLILICVSDTGIGPVCEVISDGRNLAGVAVAHVAGGIGLEVLDPAVRAGARAGKLHPLASLSGGAARLRGAVWGLDGPEALVEDLSRLVERLDGIPMSLRQVDLALYHLSAVFASNYLLGLLYLAVQLWERSGAPIAAAQALLPLVRGTLSNLDELGFTGAITGPIARGDGDALVTQLRTVMDEAPDVEGAFRVLGLATVAIASNRPDADRPLLSQIGRLLRGDAMVD